MEAILLGKLSDHSIGHTPLYCADSYCRFKNLFVKLEMHNPLGSIKDRAAYYILRDLIDTGKLKRGMKIVESSSGNLGLALGYFANQIGVEFLCLVDPTIPKDKVHQLDSKKIKTYSVDLGSEKSYRDARIRLASELESTSEWIWTRQYENISNVMSHFETTGPEIWEQTNKKIDYIIGSTGTGGTICGVGLFLKKMNPAIEVIAVEPLGSTIFGGTPGCYLSVGSGMSCASTIIKKFGYVIDFWAQVADKDAISECRQFLEYEKINIGITSGAALVVASKVAKDNPNKTIVVISPDGGENYAGLFERNSQSIEYQKANSIILHSLKDQ